MGVLMPSFPVPPHKPVSESELLTAADQPIGQTTKSMSAPLTMRTPSTPPWYYRFIISLIKPLYRMQVWHRSHNRDNYQQEVAQRFGKDYPPRPTAGFDYINATDINNTDISSADTSSTDVSSADVNKVGLNQTVIWCHAVSLGETNTVAPLLDALLAHGYQIWLTNTTQTGFARGASRFADDIAQGRLSHSYVPVDSPAVIETFLAHVQPVAALFVETELWANILAKLAGHHIPSILVNGRLSASSFTRYQKISAVSRSMMQNLTLIIAQDDESAQRFCQLGAYRTQIRVAGSLKWVINTPKREAKINHINDDNAIAEKQTEKPADKQKGAVESNIKNGISTELGKSNRPIWVAASTHSGEEEAALSLQQQILSIPALADTLLIIVPRHPERFDEVADLIKKSGLGMARRSINEAISTQTQVYLADSMGELMQWYTLADVALVGGSLVAVGGHNPVEPSSVGTPVLMGPYTQSCQSVVDKLAGVGALYQPDNHFYQPLVIDEQITDGQTVKQHKSEEKTPQFSPKPALIADTTLIYEQLQLWLSNPQLATLAGQAGEQLTLQQQSVLTRQLTMIEEVVKQFNSNKA